MNSRERIGWVFVFAAAIFLYVMNWRTHYVGFYFDDADYILSALSPSAPMSRWPGFSWALVPVVGLVAPHWEWVKCVPFVCVVASIGLLAMWFRRLYSPVLALAATALVAWNPWTVDRSGAVMAEPLMMLLVLLVLAPLDRWRKQSSSRWVWTLGVVAAAAALVRPEGLLVGFSVATAFLIVDGWASTVRFFSTSFFLMLGLLYAFHAHGSVYWSDWQKNNGLWAPSYVCHQVSALGLTLFSGLTFTIPVPHHAWLWTVSALVSLVSLVAIGLGFKNQSKTHAFQVLAVALFSVSYFVAHVFWPVVSFRMVWILLPFVIYGLLSAVDWSRRSHQVVGGLTIVAVLVSSLWSDVKLSAAVMLMPTASLDWIRSATASNNEFLALNPSVITLYTHRPAVGLHGAALVSSGAFRYDALSRGITHIYYMRRPLSGTNLPSTDQLVNRWVRSRLWLEAQPSAYTRLYGPDQDGIVIYGITKDPNYIRAYDLYRSALEDWNLGRIVWAQAKLLEALREEPDFPEARAMTQVIKQNNPAALLSRSAVSSLRTRRSSR